MGKNKVLRENGQLKIVLTSLANFRSSGCHAWAGVLSV